MTSSQKFFASSHHILDVISATEEDFVLKQNQKYINYHNQMIPIFTLNNLFEKNIASSSRKTIVPHRPRVVDILNAIRNIDHFSFLG